MTAYSKTDFKKFCTYISSIDVDHDENTDEDVPLCIHISAHGNDDGVSFGNDFLGWKDLFSALNPLFKKIKYPGDIFIVISSCLAGNQKLTEEIETNWTPKSKVTLPKYVFVTGDEDGVAWDDAVVSLALFYYKISSRSLGKKIKIQNILKEIKTATGSELWYFRWDDNKSKYLKYKNK